MSLLDHISRLRPRTVEEMSLKVMDVTPRIPLHCRDRLRTACVVRACRRTYAPDARRPLQMPDRRPVRRLRASAQIAVR